MLHGTRFACLYLWKCRVWWEGGLVSYDLGPILIFEAFEGAVLLNGVRVGPGLSFVRLQCPLQWWKTSVPPPVEHAVCWVGEWQVCLLSRQGGHVDQLNVLVTPFPHFLFLPHR